MKICTLALILMSFPTASVFAAPISPADAGAIGLGETVGRLESRYPGKVVAIELDDSGDTAAHYHVDMRFPQSGLARLDVDAETIAITSREPEPLPAGSAPLVYAVALVTAAVPGQLLSAELDATNGTPAHYDVDVALLNGSVARLKVDAATKQIAWRSPPIMND